MLDDAAKQALVEQFRACLDEPEDPHAEDPGQAGEPIDLSTLLAEMAALKNDVRLQSRQFKAALEQTQALADALREQAARLERDLERARAKAGDARAEAERGLLLGLLELRDRLQAGLDAQAQWRPSALQRLLGADSRFAASLREGSSLTLARLDELLAAYRVRPVVCVGQGFDPQTMHAVAVEADPRSADGVVLRELRRGFCQGPQLLRAAEVIVNKLGSTP